MIGIPAVPGFWCDYYGCWEDNIVETINYMLTLHTSDFPITCCVGFTVIYPKDEDKWEGKGMVKIYPKVRHGGTKIFTYDHYTGEKSEN